MTEVVERPPAAAAPPLAPKATFATRVREGLQSALLHDLPLKVLALLLAFMAWLVVRSRIVTGETIQDVAVQIVVPDAVVVVAPEDTPLVNLRLRGSWSQVARAKRALREGHVMLRLPDLEATARKVKEGVKGPISDATAFTFPFEDPEIVTVLRSITVNWMAVDERTLPVAAPTVVGTDRGQVEATVLLDEKSTSVTVRGPFALFVPEPGPMTPDEVNASSWLKGKPELSTPWRWESDFRDWRKADWRLRRPGITKIEPETVRGRVKFRAVGGRVLESRVAEQYRDPAWNVTHAYEIQISPEYDRAAKTLRASIVADPSVLERLEKNPDDWHFYVVMPPPEDGAVDGAHKELPVFLHLPHNVTASFEKPPTLFVTIRRRKE